MESSKRRTIRNVPISIEDLPICIMFEIFSRLSITILSACKAVCKVWYMYISDPEFGNYYSKKQPYVTVMFSSPVDSTYSLLELKADQNDELGENSFRIVRNQLLFPNQFETLLGSCNGLLLSVHHSRNYGRQLSIWNPLTGECGLLPQPKEEINVKMDMFLFGFSEKTKEYKVLRIFTRKWKRGKTEARICTIGIDEDWRILNQDAPFPEGRSCSPKVFYDLQFCEVINFNEALHWMTGDLERHDFLFSFDIGEEKVRCVPRPHGMFIRNGYTSLGVLKDCLCIFQIWNSRQLDIWTMREYGVSQSWTKETILFPVGMIHRYYPTRLFRRTYPIVSWGGKGILMCNGRTLISYFPEENGSTKVIVRVDFGAFPPRCPCWAGWAIPYVPCFLSFKDLMKGCGGELKFVEKKTNQAVQNINRETAVRHSWARLRTTGWFP